MNNDNQTTLQDGLQEKITQKEQEVEHYKGVLDRYGRGRWYHLGKRTLEGLEDELAALRAQLPQELPLESFSADQASPPLVKG